MYKKILSLLLIIFLASSISSPILASSDIVLPPQRVNPDSVFYPIKRFYEKARAKLYFSDLGKAKYHFRLLEKRLSEMEYLSDNKFLDPLESASQRVSYEAGRATELLVASEQDEETKEKFKGTFDRLIKYLPEIRDRYAANTSYWLLTQQNIDTLSILRIRLE